MYDRKQEANKYQQSYNYSDNPDHFAARSGPEGEGFTDRTGRQWKSMDEYRDFYFPEFKTERARQRDPLRSKTFFGFKRRPDYEFYMK